MLDAFVIASVVCICELCRLFMAVIVSVSSICCMYAVCMVCTCVRSLSSLCHLYGVCCLCLVFECVVCLCALPLYSLFVFVSLSLYIYIYVSIISAVSFADNGAKLNHHSSWKQNGAADTALGIRTLRIRDGCAEKAFASMHWLGCHPQSTIWY